MAKSPTATLPRFLAPDLVPGAATVRLPPDEAHHLTRVLRLGAGDRVRVFDGRGHERLATVVTARDRDAVLALGEIVAVPAASPVALTLVQAVLKGEAMDAVVRDATMFGVSAIQPVTTAHLAVKASQAVRPAQTARWQRIAVASAKQSRRATVPVVAPTIALDAALAATPSMALIFVEPSAARAAGSLRDLLAAPRPREAALLVGPEGGWGAAEIEAAVAAGARPVSLGPLTLRAEAVPLAALAIVGWIWEDDPAAAASPAR